MSKQSAISAPTPENAVNNAPKGYTEVVRPLVYISWVHKDDFAEDDAWARIFGLYAINRYTIPVMPCFVLNALYGIVDNGIELTSSIRIGEIMLSKCDECWSFEDRPGHCNEDVLKRARELDIPIRHLTFDLREFDHEG